MIHSSVFDGSINDIQAVINPRPTFAVMQSVTSPIAVTERIKNNVDRILKNRIDTPLFRENQDGVKSSIYKTVEDTRDHVNKWVHTEQSPSKKRYYEGIFEATNVVESYLNETPDVYNILNQVNQLISTLQLAHDTIINKEKPFYAGMISALINFMDVLSDEIEANKISSTASNVHLTRQVNLPDFIPTSNSNANYSMKIPARLNAV